MFDSNKGLCGSPLTAFFCDGRPGAEALVSTSIAAADNVVREDTLQWLALTLTPGLGPTRARRLVEPMGTVAAVFRASLTELEATGLLAVSAQALGTGKSLELAQEEIARTMAAGVRLARSTALPTRLA